MAETKKTATTAENKKTATSTAKSTTAKTAKTTATKTASKVTTAKNTKTTATKTATKANKIAVSTEDKVATKTSKASTAKAPKAEVNSELKEAKAPVKVAKKSYDGPMIKITQIKSSAGRLEKQQKTLVALGLRKIGQSVIKKDNEQTRGMIYVVAHLVKVEKV